MKGIVFLSDVGMIGFYDGILGMKCELIIEKFMIVLLKCFEVVEIGWIILFVCILEIDD